MAFTVTATVNSSIPPELQAPAGVHQGFIQAVHRVEGKKYQSEEPQTMADVVCEVSEGPLKGKRANRLCTASLNPKSTLNPFYEAATGVTPVGGVNYDIESDMVGKAVMFVVKLHTPEGGGSPRLRIENIYPASFGQAAPPVEAALANA